MDDNLNLLEEFQNQLVQREVIFHSLTALNRRHKVSNPEYIIYINIRSLNANHIKLQAYIENFECQPNVIICAKTWVMDSLELYNIPGYKIFYNDSKINQNDVCVIVWKAGMYPFSSKLFRCSWLRLSKFIKSKLKPPTIR